MQWCSGPPFSYFTFIFDTITGAQPGFDSFLVAGWNTVLSSGDVSRLANPTLLC